MKLDLFNEEVVMATALEEVAEALVAITDFGELDKTLRAVENATVTQRGMNERFRAICRWGYSTTAVNAAKAMFLIGQINGLRRMDLSGQAVKDKIVELARETDNWIQYQAEGPTKDRQIELLSYNMAEFGRKCGSLDAAALAQQKAAALARKNGDIERALICEYSAADNWIHDAIINGLEEDVLLEVLEEAREAAIALQQGIDPDGDLDHWATLNMPYSRIINSYLTGIDYDEYEEDLATLKGFKEIDPVMAEEHEGAMALCMATKALKEGWPQAAYMAAKTIVDGQVKGTTEEGCMVTAQLILADIQVADGETQRARKGLSGIVESTGEGIHHVIAVAKRRLEALDK